MASQKVRGGFSATQAQLAAICSSSPFRTGSAVSAALAASSSA